MGIPKLPVVAPHNGESGFSLIELMIVVAIISVLSTVAIPNYQHMASRARQAEAKSGLAAIYVAEKAFYAEQSTYTYCLYQAGYIPEGSRRFYTTGFKGGSGCATCSTDYNSGIACSYALIAWSGSVRNDATFTHNSAANPTLLNAVAPDAFMCNADSFLAVGYGSVSSLPIFDIMTMDQNRVLTNIQPGY